MIADRVKGFMHLKKKQKELSDEIPQGNTDGKEHSHGFRR